MEIIKPEKPDRVVERHFISLGTILNYLLFYCKNFEEGRRILEKMSLPYILGEIDDYLKIIEEILKERKLNDLQIDFNIWYEGVLNPIVFQDERIKKAFTSFMIKIEGIASLEYFLIKIFLIAPMFPKEEVEKIIKKFDNVFKFTNEQKDLIKSLLETYYNKQQEILKDFSQNNPQSLIEKYLDINLSQFKNQIGEIIKNVRIEIIPLGFLFIVKDSAPKEFLERIFVQDDVELIGKLGLLSIAILLPQDYKKEDLYNFTKRTYLEEFFHLLEIFYLEQLGDFWKKFFSLYYESFYAKQLNFKDFVRKIIIEEFELKDFSLEESLNSIDNIIFNFFMSYINIIYTLVNALKYEIIDKILSIYYVYVYLSPYKPIPKSVIKEKEEWVSKLKKYFKEEVFLLYKSFFIKHFLQKISDIFKNFENNLTIEIKSLISRLLNKQFLSEENNTKVNNIVIRLIKELIPYLSKENSNFEEFIQKSLGDYLEILFDKSLNSLEKLLLNFNEKTIFSLHTILRFLSFYPLNLWPFIIDNLIIEVIKDENLK